MELIERIGWYSIAVNLGIAALDLGMTYLSGSLALAAETVHNIVDLTAAAAILIGLKLAYRKSSNFPYGLYKVENMVATMVAVFVLFTGYEIVKDAVFTFGRRVLIQPLMFGGVAVAALLPFLFGQYELRVGRSLNSPSLIAAGKEFQVHILSSGVVLAALVGQLLGWSLDRVMAILIAAFVLWTGWKLLVDGMRVLLDASLDQKILSRVREIIEAEPGVEDAKRVVGRSAGRYRFVEAEVTLKVTELQKAHVISDRIEETIRAQVPYVEQVIVHYEPVTHTQIHYAVPLADPIGTVNDEFGAAPYFALVTVRVSDRKLEKVEIVTNPYTTLSKGRGIRIAEWLVAHKTDVVLTQEELQNKGPGYVLANSGVQVHRVDARTLAETLKRLTICGKRV
ncbi:MAG TPA: cation diffusion facilitator family transporter [Terriglobales bacterium]|nr:cation diffusion facilitator family transporter [Terriglobales bacterium]